MQLVVRSAAATIGATMRTREQVASDVSETRVRIHRTGNVYGCRLVGSDFGVPVVWSNVDTDRL